MIARSWKIIAIASVLGGVARADAPKVDLGGAQLTFGGFIDTYYAYDFNRPDAKDRTYGNPGQPMIVPSRHNEFNVNLAYLEAKLSGDRVRGRLALQAGTSVQANYAAEPTKGMVSGPSLGQHLQEANVGYRIADGLWVDAGIFFSHIGFESFISNQNWTYSRAYMADNSPYYQTGVRLGYQLSPAWLVGIHVLNGWNNISDNNDNKAVGTQLTFTPSDRVTVNYSSFYGEEVGSRWRFFNNFYAKVALTKALSVAPLFDIGFEKKASGSGSSTWYGVGLQARYQLDPKLAVSARVEHYSDPDRIIVQPADATKAFVAQSATVTVDYELYKNLLWRNEARVNFSRDDVFPKGSGASTNGALALTSLSFSF